MYRDVKIAMHYQHPEVEIVRAALDYRPPTSRVAAQQIGLRHFLRYYAVSRNMPHRVLAKPRPAFKTAADPLRYAVPIRHSLVFRREGLWQFR